MHSDSTKPRITPQEYLALQRRSPTPNEFRDGRIVPRPPSSRAHSLIVGNVTGEIGNQTEARPCEVYAVAMRLLVEATGLFTYPDVSVVVEGPKFHDREFDTLLNPTVIFEVLSESTEAYDRGVKFGHYRRIPSLREYVLVAQDRMLVERYTRQGDDWLLSEFTSPEQAVRLESIDCTIPLERIYAKVKFDQTNDAGQLHPR